ncbi:magnesium transporter MRS2-11, chloroplastic [Selaginella moellendorffii]|nr:magnesium transporter MRS2-11, chloroplastic [Selaginella moellendorffii]|eukprot:XP_002970772.2 magnesium transporter MRS2-11, chloroplastic [Selaginella moellendorffii]
MDPLLSSSLVGHGVRSIDLHSKLLLLGGFSYGSSPGIQKISSARRFKASGSSAAADKLIDDRSAEDSPVSSSIGVKEPVYEVLQVDPRGNVIKKEVSRRQLLKTSGLRLRDIRSVDPSLWVTNSMPSLLVRDNAILLNLGSLRAIATPESVLLFDHKNIGAQLFLETIVQRLNVENSGSVSMPFELEVIEAALISRTQRLEQTLMKVEPKVLALLEILPNKLTGDVLEDLRVSKQSLVELIAKSDALRQMLLDLLETPQDIRRMAILGRNCRLGNNGSFECVVSADKQIAEDEEEEIEMLIENYLQRSESCHGQAQKLLDSAREMEDSIAVNLSSRRLEVGRLELLLQVATFCSALGALIAGLFGMNLRSYLEERTYAFWLTTGGIIVGGIMLFLMMYNYLKQRRIL